VETVLQEKVKSLNKLRVYMLIESTGLRLAKRSVISSQRRC